jgi:predicted membrane protein
MSPRVVFGLMVVAFGLAMLLDNLNVLSALALLRFWPVGLLLVGVAYMVQADGRSERIFGGILTAVGVVFVLEIFFGIEVQIWRWWPLAIVAFGALVIAKAFRPEEPPAKYRSASSLAVRASRPRVRRRESPRGPGRRTRPTRSSRSFRYRTALRLRRSNGPT